MAHGFAVSNKARDAAFKDAARAAVREEVQPLIGELQRFVDRRVAELSAEVHGAAQLMGFSETNLSGQLARLHEQVAKTIAAPAQGTHNTGVELEAVVQTTEAAAHQIMEAAEAISDCLRATVSDKAAIAAINSKIDAIFEACAFQDITGQRVRRAIEQLQTVESALSTMMAPIDAESDAAHQETEEPACTTGPELPQADVDALFAA